MKGMHNPITFKEAWFLYDSLISQGASEEQAKEIMNDILEGKVRTLRQMSADTRREVQERRNSEEGKGNLNQPVEETIEEKRKRLLKKDWMLCIFCNVGVVPHGVCGVRCSNCGGYLDCADGGIN